MSHSVTHNLPFVGSWHHRCIRAQFFQHIPQGQTGSFRSQIEKRRIRDRLLLEVRLTDRVAVADHRDQPGQYIRVGASVRRKGLGALLVQMERHKKRSCRTDQGGRATQND